MLHECEPHGDRRAGGHVLPDELFHVDKSDSGTGWPSFITPLANVVENVDRSHGITRTEVRTKHGDSPSRPSVS